VPIQIGGKRESDFGDPIGLLGDCHRRIERFLATLVVVATEAQGGPLTAEHRSALATALRYFRDAAPKHTADEEESLFPRLRRLDQAEVQPLFARIDSLQQDHVSAGRGHSEVDRLGELWLAEGVLSPQDAERLATLLSELAELYSRHIAIEDGEIFPFAAKSLSPSDREAIGLEMTARRGIAAGVPTHS
jgi:hemerythrin-like domain-containing protein